MTEQQAARRHRRCAVFVLCLLVVLNLFMLGLSAMKMLRGVPNTYSEIEEHFKYGSVGSDTLKQGFPYWIWKVLPTMFKDLLPPNGKPGYEAFGLIVERTPPGDPNGDPIEDRPIGLSKRRIGFKQWGALTMVGLNCAFCHASTLRQSESSRAQVILGMPGNTVDVEEFLVFLFKTAKDRRFTGNEVMKAVEKQRRVELQQAYAPMGFIKATAYQWIVIPLYQWEIGKLERKFCFIKKLGANECATTKLVTDAGPGRLDLWAGYKVLRFATWTQLGDLLPDLTPSLIDSIDMDIGQAPGVADAAPLWQLEKRMGRGFHWDGNTRLLSDYTIIAALGLNVIPRSLDVPSFNRIARWARTRPPPRYNDFAPSTVNSDRSEKGRNLYFQHCASCHDPGGMRFGAVEPIDAVGTDRNRFDAFTEELANKLTRVRAGYNWRLRNFGKTDGYSNLPLDGIWLRAPYLHNGSVPTLRDLLKKPKCRVGEAKTPPDKAQCEPNETTARAEQFCRGNDLYNWKDVGFKADLSKSECEARGFFWYDTTEKGNSNRGHLYGTDLSDVETEALLESLKTL